MLFDIFVSKQFGKEMKRLGYVKRDLLTDIWKFRFACFKLNYFLKHLALPTIKQQSYYEAVLIEFRILPHIEFIIRNAILKLNNEWSFSIVCGQNNVAYLTDICKQISPKIKIIRLPYGNLTQQEYSNLLMTTDFWKLFYGEKILILQEDSLIFKSGIKPFLKYDFIGAPFHKSSNDTPNKVGNGGFSLRTKCKMIEVIENCPVENVSVPSTTQLYMEMVGMTNIPEDVYFSKCLQEKHIGEVANWDTAREFSTEQVFNPHSFGGHKFWISNPHWKPFLKQLFHFSLYQKRSDLNHYLNFKHLSPSLNKNHSIPNAFDVDIYFFCKANNIEHKNDALILEYIKIMALDGFIYHPKQVQNIFPNVCFYQFQDNIYVYSNRQIYTLQGFVNKFLYNSSFDLLCEELITKKHDTINDNYNKYLLVFLGNEDIAISLIQKIIQYKKIETNFNVAFCINRYSIKNKHKIKQLIRENFDFYCIYYSKEFGTDITPTILMYNDLLLNHSNIKHIIKLHTKSVSVLYEELTDYLLTNTIDKIVQEKVEYCNCIGPAHLYRSLVKDLFNKQLVQKHEQVISTSHSFVMGTMFYTEIATFNSILRFVRNNNYRAYLLNNLYENNSINQDFSPIHFLERLFGTIIL